MDPSSPISVLMPVLNPHPVFFLKAVRSILDQSHAELELVIVEDPSPCAADDFLKVVSDPRIRHIRNATRTSLASQLNRGLSEARYDLVARMDADDVAHSDRLQKQLQFLCENPTVDVVGSHLNIIDAEGKRRGCRRYPVGHDAILGTMPFYSPLAHPSVLLRRSLVAQAGGYREVNPEDYDLWSRLAKAGARFANFPEPLMDYRIHPESFKSAKLSATIRGTLAVKRQYWMNEMGVRGRLRMLGEQTLLWLPPKLVLRIFMWMYYRRG
jgi:glycosyltransferase involved in cell wall biosynthesis